MPGPLRTPTRSVTKTTGGSSSFSGNSRPTYGAAPGGATAPTSSLSFSAPSTPPAQQAARAPRVTQPQPLVSDGGNPDLGGGGGALSSTPGGIMATAAPAPIEAPAPPSQEEYYANDESRIMEDAGTKGVLDTLKAMLLNQRTNYDTNYGNSMKSLGWKGNSLNAADAGGWDQEDTSGAYGQSFQNQENDYAGRGMMNSSFYDIAQQKMLDGFNNQKLDMSNGRTQQRSDWQGQEDAGVQAAGQANAQSKMLSYARRAAQYGLPS